MKIIVLTPGVEVFNGEAKSVNVPGTGGRFEILDNHAPLVSSLTEGSVKLAASDGTIKNFNITRGFIEVNKNEVSLLVQGYSAE